MHATLVLAAICSATIVVIALSVNDACSASVGLGALSEPFASILFEDSKELLREHLLDDSATLLGVLALVGLVVLATRGADIDSAWVSVVATLDVLAESVFGEADVFGARVKVVALGIFDALFLKDADTLAESVAEAVTPGVWVLVVSVAVDVDVALVAAASLDRVLSGHADASKAGLSAVLVALAGFSLELFAHGRLFGVLLCCALLGGLCHLFLLEDLLFLVRVLGDLLLVRLVLGLSLGVLLDEDLLGLDELLLGGDLLLERLDLVLVDDLLLGVFHDLLFHHLDVSLVHLVLFHLGEGLLVLFLDSVGLLDAFLFDLLH